MKSQVSLIRRIMALAIILSVIINMSLNFSCAESKNTASNKYNLVVVMDASNSMNTTDPQGLRYKAVDQFVSLMSEKGNMLGGIVFSNNVSQKKNLIPADNSSAKSEVTDALSSVEPKGYTNIGEALLTAVDMINEEGNPDLKSVILFLSDGNTEMPTEDTLSKSLEQKADAIQKARDNNIEIYTICLNANNKADTSEMIQISESTDGVFEEIAKASDLNDAFNTFYSLIYGTESVTLIDESFNDNGTIEKKFNVPGFGVEEINILIYGTPKEVIVLKPDGTESPSEIESHDAFSLVKVTETEAGEWTLNVKGNAGEKIKVNMVYNTDLSVSLKAKPKDTSLYPGTKVTVTAALQSGEEKASDKNQYIGYEGELRIFNAKGEQIDKVPMKITNDGFSGDYSFKEGAYFYDVCVSGNSLSVTSETVGPLEISEKNNTAPVPVEKEIEKTVYTWPFKGGSLTMDLNELAKDEQDDRLKYEIVSTSFLKDTDFTVDDENMLTLEHFSLKKGELTVRAIDSGGLYCDINVKVKNRNVGVMALIGLGIAGVIALIVMGIILYILITRPFRGTISVQSYNSGKFSGKSRSPRRGRCKLSHFDLDGVGLNYSKSYFQATGKTYIYFHTNIPVFWCGQKTKKIRIDSGSETQIYIDENDYSKYLLVRFESRIQGIKRRRGRR